MKVLIAIDNAGQGASVALAGAEPPFALLGCLPMQQAGQQAEQVLPQLTALLQAHGVLPTQIAGVAFSQGPGGFTGLRVACALAQGIAIGLGVPVLPVSTLDAYAHALAQTVGAQSQLLMVATDARMQEAYVGVYVLRQGQAQPITPSLLLPMAQLSAWQSSQQGLWSLMAGVDPAQAMWVTGNAFAHTPQGVVVQDPSAQPSWPVQATYHHQPWPAADALLAVALERWRQGQTVAPEQAAPLYLRDKVAFTTQERAQGLGGNPLMALPMPTRQTQAESALYQALQAQQCWIRPASIADLDAIMAIETVSHATPWSTAVMADALQRPDYAAVVLQQGQAVIGYLLQYGAPDTTQLMTIAIAPSHRGLGLGRCLMQYGELVIAYRPGWAPVQLLEVRASNQVALALYQGMGYQSISRRKGYYALPNGNEREDAIVMQKSLGVSDASAHTD